MPRYDLREYRGLPRVKYVAWFRLAFTVFLGLLLLWTFYGTYIQSTDGMLDAVRLTGVILVFIILGLFGFVVAAIRPQAVDLTIDASGVRLDYLHGSPYVRSWEEPRTRLQGRYTIGDSARAYGGQPICSVFARFGALTESFVPKAAYDELVSMATSHGFVLTERDERQGWILYSLRRVDGHGSGGGVGAL